MAERAQKGLMGCGKAGIYRADTTQSLQSAVCGVCDNPETGAMSIPFHRQHNEARRTYEAGPEP